MGEHETARTGTEVRRPAEAAAGRSAEWLPALWADRRPLDRDAEDPRARDERATVEPPTDEQQTDEQHTDEQQTDEHGADGRPPAWLTALWAGPGAGDRAPLDDLALVEGRAITDDLAITDELAITDDRALVESRQLAVQAPADAPEPEPVPEPVPEEQRAEVVARPGAPVPGEDPDADAARRRRLAAWSAVARARHDVAVAEAVLARDAGTDRARWEADTHVAEEIHAALVAARAEARHHRRRRPDLVGLELAERLALERLGCDRYEDLVLALAERGRDERTPSVGGREDIDLVALDDAAALELARAELQAAVAAWHALDEEQVSDPG